MKNKEQTKAKKRKSLFKKFMLVILLAILITGTIFGYRVYKNGGGLQGILATAVGHNEKTVKNLPKIYCLLLGQSQNLTDTLIIAEYSPQDQQASILSIPRDTFVGDSKSNASGMDKINAIYQISPEKLLQKVNNLTGLNIKYYLKVDTSAFKELVDAVGGVEFNVPIDMKYDDRKQNLHINLKAGVQLLDGDKAEQVVRFRHNNDGSTYPYKYGIEDMGRMKTQRNFLTALAKKALKIENIVKINDFLEIAKKYVETNLDFNIVKNYIPYIVKFDIANLKSGHLPGVAEQAPNGLWIYSPNQYEVDNMVDNLFLNTNKDDNIADNDTLKKDRKNISLEILNGTDNNDYLENLITKLEKLGYDVKKVGNTTPTAVTTVIKRSDVNENIQQEIMKITKVDNFVKGEQNQVTFTIIIGQDF